MLKKMKVPLKVIAMLNAAGIGLDPPDKDKRIPLSYSKIRRFIALNHPVDPDTS